jgi:hypothetical protein
VALDTYANLQSEVASYLGRSDLTDKIKTFIALAEKRFNRELRLRIMEVLDNSLVTVAGTQYVALPPSFLEMRQVTINGSPPTPLAYITPDRFAIQAGESGRPSFYSIVGDKLYFAPVPDGVHSISLTYYSAITPLSDAAPTNSLLTNHPDIYLYGALVESGPYTRTTAPLAAWVEYLTKAIDGAGQADQRARFTSQVGMRPIRRV